MVRAPGNRRLLLRGTKVACPRCQGVLRLRRVADWKGVEPMWELRCTKCRRNLFTKANADG